MRLSSKRAAALSLLVFAGGCYTQASDRAVPAAVVNDACGGHATLESCAAVAGCEWRAVKTECPIDAVCPGGVCVTPDAAAAAARENDMHFKNTVVGSS